MVNWSYYPHNIPADYKSSKIVEIFTKIEAEIDSDRYTYSSNEVLAIVEPYLSKLGFAVERGKSAKEKITVPVLFGKNGKAELNFNADAYDEEAGYVIEVEAGRAVDNYRFLKDFFEA